MGCDCTVATGAVCKFKYCFGLGVPWDDFPFLSEDAAYDSISEGCFKRVAMARV